MDETALPQSRSAGSRSQGARPVRPILPWKRWDRQTRHNFRVAMLFISPWFIGLALFTLYPMLASLYYSFTEYHPIKPTEWVGLQNYATMLTDKLFWKSLANTLYMVAIGVPLILLASFSCAVLLNLKVRGQSIYRVIYFLPSVVPVIASTMLWLWILNPQVGILNTFLARLGIDGPNWMRDPTWSKPSLILLGLWGMGSTIVIYLSGLQDVPVCSAGGRRTGRRELAAQAVAHHHPHGIAHHPVQPDHGRHRHVPVLRAGLRLRQRLGHGYCSGLHRSIPPCSIASTSTRSDFNISGWVWPRPWHGSCSSSSCSAPWLLLKLSGRFTYYAG